MIRAVIFDWGGVLIEDPANDLIIQAAKHLNTSIEEMHVHLKEHTRRFQEGKITEHELFEKFLKSLLQKSIWKKAVQSCFKDHPQMWQIIKDLRKKGYKTALLSNTEDPTVEYFLEQQYDAYFDVMVFSCVEKVAKPDKKIYEITLQKLNVKPSESVFIDDKEENIIAPQKIGIQTIHFKNVQQCIDEIQTRFINH